MAQLVPISIFFAGLFGGLGLFFIGSAALWWVYLQSTKAEKQKE